MDPRYAGSNSLIRDGAILVRDANDILSVLGRPRSPRNALEKPAQKSADTDTARVVQALGSVPTAVDELVRRCQVSAASIAEVLHGSRAGGPLGEAPG